MPTLDLYKLESHRLARVFALDTASPGWGAGELAAILRHQLTADVRFDLPGAEFGSFGELLQAADPPLKLLELTKQFAKAHRAHPDSPLPDGVASVLYFGSILVARMRLGRQISDLTDPELRRGVRWVARQPWVDEQTRNLFEEGLRFLDAARETVP